MKTLIVLLATLILSFSAFAADSACMSQATEKKLSGTAQNSFIRKCVRDSCEATSLEKKLAGAAKIALSRNVWLTDCSLTAKARQTSRNCMGLPEPAS